MKVVISESQYNSLVDNFITFLFEPHEAKIIPRYPNSISWIKDDEIFVSIVNRRMEFWVLGKYWNQISEQFGFKNSQTEFAIKNWLAHHYGIRLKPRFYPFIWDL